MMTVNNRLDLHSLASGTEYRITTTHTSVKISAGNSSSTTPYEHDRGALLFSHDGRWLDTSALPPDATYKVKRDRETGVEITLLRTTGIIARLFGR